MRMNEERLYATMGHLLFMLIFVVVNLPQLQFISPKSIYLLSNLIQFDNKMINSFYNTKYIFILFKFLMSNLSPTISSRNCLFHSK